MVTKIFIRNSLLKGDRNLLSYLRNKTEGEGLTMFAKEKSSQNLQNYIYDFWQLYFYL
jgi:hypothetical protein